jgi:hypothetical protein
VCATVSELPPESEKLLAVAPSEFVAARQRLVEELRKAGKPAEANAVAGMRKPSAVVLAVNRAARDRPKAAQAAAEAAKRLAKEQAGGDPERFRAVSRELDRALDMLSDVGVAHVSPGGKKPSDAMRKRVHDLLRRAVAREETRAALERGALLEEQEATGFSPFEGMATKPKSRKGAAAPPSARAKRREEEQRKRAKALREELARAEDALAGAEQAVRGAERERAKAERAVAAARSKLDRVA